MFLKYNVMEIILKKVSKTNGDRILRVFVFSCLFLFFTSSHSYAQTPDSASDVAVEDTLGASSDGFATPENKSKLFEEARKIQEQNRKDEIWQYVIMVGGFSIVIGIAWFTTSLARKRRKKEDEVRAIRAAHQMKHKSHHHPKR
ncbi:hypothetical protein BH10BAC1_BH10BAC1_08160 [soil metagenome]